MWLVVGLGNPGSRYARNRHNVGFMAVDLLAERLDSVGFREKFSGEYAKVELSGEPAVLLKPQTFMNVSGDCVQPAAAFFKVPPERIIVIHDELDLSFGDVRLKLGGGHAGHNGLRSVTDRLGTNEFGRVRVGVGRPPAEFRGDVAAFVLSDFSSDEREMLPDTVRKIRKSVLEVARRGWAPAMKLVNARPKKKKTKIQTAEPTAKAPDRADSESEVPRSGDDVSRANDRGVPE